MVKDFRNLLLRLVARYEIEEIPIKQQYEYYTSAFGNLEQRLNH